VLGRLDDDLRLRQLLGATGVVRGLVGVASDQRLVAALHDPQALVSPDAQAALGTLARQVGPSGQAQLDQLLDLSRLALAGGIRAGYWLALGAAVIVLGLIFAMREPQRSAEPAAARSEELHGGLDML